MKNHDRVRAVKVRRREQERGSALLIVLVFAAVIAIMLYRELPIAAFEAQRQKEELLVARGNEYKRGVKLFVRKVGRFPGSIEELENTNRMRFLRHRYVDPLTGKDDWRLIHAGPGGVIMDSKVATANNNKNSNALGQGATFAGFNNSFTGDTAAAAEAAAENTPSAGQRQRPPATKNAASGTSTDPLAAIAGVADSPETGNGNALGGNVPNQLPGSQNNPGNGVTSMADQLNAPPTPQGQPPQPNSGGLGNTSAFGNNNSGVFGNNNGQNGQNGAVGTTPGNGQITMGGGIAGVASNAEGKGIKLVNDQKKYKLWEFYYDLRKEQQQGAPGLGQGQNVNGLNGQQQNQQGQSAFGNNSSAFGSGSSSFGGNGGSSFGSGSNQMGSPQQPPTPQPQPQ